MASPTKIAITGGKGGTGKSTFSILLAKQLLQNGKNVLLCDCDVECPNDYLLLGQKLGTAKQKSYTEFPKLIKSKCKKCGLCAKGCKNNAIFAPVGRYPVFIKDLCSGCGVCKELCPFGAIKTVKEETGKIYLNKVISSKEGQKNFWLVTGAANAGLEETGPIVSQTKKFALGFARKNKVNIILFDTAAGTHCPVIHALIGVDFSYLVTEPTPMGAHDLGLMLDLCKKLNVKTKIIINQTNLGNKQRIKSIVKNSETEIAGEIPFSKQLLKAYSKGKLLNLKIGLPSYFNHSELLETTQRNAYKISSK